MEIIHLICQYIPTLASKNTSLLPQKLMQFFGIRSEDQNEVILYNLTYLYIYITSAIRSGAKDSAADTSEILPTGGVQNRKYQLSTPRLMDLK